MRLAFQLAQQGHLQRSALIYTELAEMGLPTAMLNAAMIFDKLNSAESQKSYFAIDVQHNKKQQMPFDLNKYLAFNYFKMAAHHADTKAEAMLKLGDFYYYGF